MINFSDDDPDPADAAAFGGSGRSHSREKAAAAAANDAPDALRLVWFADIQPCLDTLDFVQGVLVERGAAVVYGDSNAGKTFWTLDLALHVADGTPWFGRRVEQGGVIYAALEGTAGFRNRVAAWRSVHGKNGRELPFASIQSPINLLDPNADTDRLIAAIQRAAISIDVPIKLVVIDTLSRALAGGNENAPDDMGALVLNMDRIRAETGASVLFIHHTGKDAAKGARGHSILRGAIDTEIEVVDNDGAKSATVEKQRELKKGDVFSFRLDVVQLGTNRHGEPVTTCTVVPTDAPVVAKAARLSGNNEIGASMLRRALEHHGQPLPGTSEYPPDVRAVTENQWRETFYKGYPADTQETKRRTFGRVKSDLIAKRIVASLNNYVWFVRA